MKKLLLLLFIICFSNVCVQAATDNVLQSIQIDTFKDTYNIILKSDEKPEAKRVINDENKIMLTCFLYFYVNLSTLFQQNYVNLSTSC